MRSPTVLAALAALTLAACDGPKSSCQGSVESWFSLVKGNKYEDMYAMIIPDHQKKVKYRKFLATMSDVYGSEDGRTKTYDWNITYGQAVESGDKCLANGEYKYVYKTLGAAPEDRGDYFSYVLHKMPDGKWYLELPGMEKISGF